MTSQRKILQVWHRSFAHAAPHTLSNTFPLSHGEQRGRCLCYGLTEALLSSSQSFQITHAFSRVKRRERPSSSVWKGSRKETSPWTAVAVSWIWRRLENSTRSTPLFLLQKLRLQSRAGEEFGIRLRSAHTFTRNCLFDSFCALCFNGTF